MLKTHRTRSGAVCNRDLIWPYLLPYGAYVLVGSIGLPRPADYALRIAIVGALLFAFRSRYQRITGPNSSLVSILVGVVGGIIAAFLWVGLLLPFQDAHTGTAFDFASFVMRLAAASLVVPLAEELLCRGFIQGFITQWQEARRAGGSIDEVLDDRSVQEITPGAWTPLAVALSSGAFAIGHSPGQMLAAFAFGVAMSALWIIRRDLLTPIVAHAITNFVLYIYVFETRSWGLW